ncbi:aminopyrimidine aminohydrolase [Aureimonas endophytica]|uniref:Aminopyrimidine aminohydrolase n=1 Tax=Aureimonas endophytica TaxID=2027858 RepID=A0A916ZUY1_9HYPH|nr:thiaminase II [Aureimonas endophytica]GGE15388.1 aminopyrimidine aminohydrolase [Aureimonas endophytica]
MSADLFARLKEAAHPHWQAYVEHDFVRRLAAGRLPNAAFRFYLAQDYLFLIQFARAQALAVYKGRTLAEMRASKSALAAILDVELGLHVRLAAEWGLTPADLESAPEHAATVAYTRFVLDAGMAGDLLDLRVALAPCVLGYAEIAARIALEVRARPGHPQGAWVEDYAGEAYQAVAEAARAELGRLAEGALSPPRLRQLERLFAKACDLEAGFWQMALDAAAKDEP